MGVRLANWSLAYLWFRDEGTSRDGEAVMDGAEILSHDGKTTPLLAACAGCQPLEDRENNHWKLLTRIQQGFRSSAQ